MCELLGFSAAKPTDISELVREFFSHSEKNPHGWGMMYDDITLVRGCEKASDSPKLAEIMKGIAPQKDLLAHIRFATVGKIKQENCHPFTGCDITGRRWTFAHNGTIYSGSSLIPYLRTQAGDTDSERVFMYLMDSVNKAQENGELSSEERCLLIDDLVRDLAPRNKLNLMIFDGEQLYVHKNMHDTMKYRREESGYIISTTALDGGDWLDVPMAQLLVFKNGEQIYSGNPHDGIFIPNLQYIKAMDAMHI
ncbi:class II glutamine amidotransferase [uncultured Ruminococcus sp.]|uniref:class II glutamine amidotransferase n=1 Tax=uncultured Ruminococcus sp. TaxID=165186 RepID=UPI0025F33E59|nr:class II glutamine amidotransferase [uncultured Ruminococcus sp.]